MFEGSHVKAYEAAWTPEGDLVHPRRRLTPTRAERVDLVVLVDGSSKPEQLVEMPVRGDEWAATLTEEGSSGIHGAVQTGDNVVELHGDRETSAATSIPSGRTRSAVVPSVGACST